MSNKLDLAHWSSGKRKFQWKSEFLSVRWVKIGIWSEAVGSQQTLPHGSPQAQGHLVVSIPHWTQKFHFKATGQREGFSQALKDMSSRNCVHPVWGVTATTVRKTLSWLSLKHTKK